jgi:hypothetical protein
VERLFSVPAATDPLERLLAAAISSRARRGTPGPLDDGLAQTAAVADSRA